MDYSDKDGTIWPMQISQGGGLYGFCPGKATWDHEAVGIYRAIILCAETGTMWTEGGIADQPAWWVDLVAEWLPWYSDMRFATRAKQILGDTKDGAQNGGHKRRN
jgi:hypothetical protein